MNFDLYRLKYKISMAIGDILNDAIRGNFVTNSCVYELSIFVTLIITITGVSRIFLSVSALRNCSLDTSILCISLDVITVIN